MKPSPGEKRRFIASLRLVREGSFPAPSDYLDKQERVNSPQTIFRFMQPYAQREEVEVFWVLALNAQSQIIRNAPVAVTRGILNSAMVHPREVFRVALLANAASIVAVHNHPSGDPTPSMEDTAMTEQLVAAGVLMGIPLLDHVIIGSDRYMSFREIGKL